MCPAGKFRVIIKKAFVSMQDFSSYTTPKPPCKRGRPASKHLKKAGGHIRRNVVEITIKMKTRVRKPLMIKINKLRLRNLDNKHLKKVGEHIGRNVVEMTIKMRTIVRKSLMIKIHIFWSFLNKFKFPIVSKFQFFFQNYHCLSTFF